MEFYFHFYLLFHDKGFSSGSCTLFFHHVRYCWVLFRAAFEKTLRLLFLFLLLCEVVHRCKWDVFLCWLLTLFQFLLQTPTLMFRHFPQKSVIEYLQRPIVHCSGLTKSGSRTCVWDQQFRPSTGLPSLWGEFNDVKPAEKFDIFDGFNDTRFHFPF